MNIKKKFKKDFDNFLNTPNSINEIKKQICFDDTVKQAYPPKHRFINGLVVGFLSASICFVVGILLFNNNASAPNNNFENVLPTSYIEYDKKINKSNLNKEYDELTIYFSKINSLGYTLVDNKIYVPMFTINVNFTDSTNFDLDLFLKENYLDSLTKYITYKDNKMSISYDEVNKLIVGAYLDDILDLINLDNVYGINFEISKVYAGEKK